MRVPPFEIPADYRQAVALQRELAGQVRLEPLSQSTRLVAGTDVAFDSGTHTAHAAVVVMDLDELSPVELAYQSQKVTFPYIPGLLSFREVPVLLACFAQLKTEPDLIICDGQGIAHPRGVGLATHLGLLLDKPTIGCAKSRLVGQHDEPGHQRGSAAPLMLHSAQVGVVLRTRTGVKPVFVSPGHLVTIEDAIRVILQCGRRRRLPEPTRLAHIEAGRCRRKMV